MRVLPNRFLKVPFNTMSSSASASLTITTKPFNESTLNKGIYLCLIHAKRIPPHIGIIFDGLFHSLTIKGSEPNMKTEALLKTISQKKIETIFFKIASHPVYSLDYLNAVFLEILKKYPVIKSMEVTCLSPIKAFFNEYYALNSSENDIIFSFIERLNNNSFILEAYSVNLSLESDCVEIPTYTQTELDEQIKAIRDEYYNS